MCFCAFLQNTVSQNSRHSAFMGPTPTSSLAIVERGLPGPSSMLVLMVLHGYPPMFSEHPLGGRLPSLRLEEQQGALSLSNRPLCTTAQFASLAYQLLLKDPAMGCGLGNIGQGGVHLTLIM